MLILLTMIVFAVLMLISLDGSLASAARWPRCLARRALGVTSLAAGSLLAAAILSVHLPEACGTAVAWAAPSESEAKTEASADATTEAATEATSTETSTTPRPSTGEDGRPLSQGLLDDLPRVVIPYESRPDWVGQLPDKSGDVHRVAITAGPYDRKSDCLRELDKAKTEAVSEYINDYLGNPRASLFVRYDLDTINRRLLANGNVHEELIEVSVGPMHQIHALLEFDPQFRAELDDAWRDVLAGTRLGQTGLAAFGVLALLGVLFTYFKVDTATRGYYSTKLQLLAALAILALIGAGVLMSGWIPQL